MTDNSNPFGRLLSVADTAELLGITVDSVSELIRTGEIAATRFGSRGSWRVDREELERYLNLLYAETREASNRSTSDATILPDLSDEFDAVIPTSSIRPAWFQGNPDF